MQKILGRLHIVLLCVCANAWAIQTNYVGIDDKYRVMHGKNTVNSAMRQVLPSTYNGAEIYYERRFDNNVGINVTFEQSQRKTETHVFSNNEDFLGTTQNSGDVTVFSNKVQAGQFNLVGYLNFLQKFEAIGQLGFLIMRTEMDGTLTASGVTTNLAPSRSYAFIPRVGLGLQYFIFKYVGLRASAAWEDTGLYRLKITNQDGLRSTIRPFNDSWCFTGGIVVKF